MSTAAPDALGYWPIDQPWPTAMTAAQLRIAFGSERGPMSETRFRQLRAEGAFRPFEVQTIVGTRYRGDLVRAHLRGDSTHAHTFGRRLTSRR